MSWNNVKKDCIDFDTLELEEMIVDSTWKDEDLLSDEEFERNKEKIGRPLKKKIYSSSYRLPAHSRSIQQLIESNLHEKSQANKRKKSRRALRDNN